MNIDAKGLRTTIYKVDDLKAAKDWYTKAFGILPYFDEPFYVGYTIAGYELGLIPEPTTSPKTTNVLSYWGVDDITDAFDIMVSNGATELETPKDVGDGVMVAMVKDPWQNVIGLIHNPFFKTESPENAVIEWAPFQLNEHTTKEELFNISIRLEKEFLIHQSGFIKRELLHEGNNNWVDLIYWESEKVAQLALDKCKDNEVAQQYFSMMKALDDKAVKHYTIIKTN
ncbi:VOC family protein [Marinoscillum sp.]|uniref:VOC family protein n=1 Tax=Marinoscillum sp. TaxID=2024838 RepID=UPI003BA86506